MGKPRKQLLPELQEIPMFWTQLSILLVLWHSKLLLQLCLQKYFTLDELE